MPRVAAVCLANEQTYATVATASLTRLRLMLEPPRHALVPQPPRHFIGSEDDVSALGAAIDARLSVLVHGMGGIGKSSLLSKVISQK